MKLGKLNFDPIENNLDLIGEPTKKCIENNKLEGILVSKVDPELSDTQSFCDKYGISMEKSVNCVIVEAKRADKTWYAACLIPATVRADINGIVRQKLGRQKDIFRTYGKSHIAVTHGLWWYIANRFTR